MPRIDNNTLRQLLNKKHPPTVESRCIASFDFQQVEEGALEGDLVISFVGPPSGGAGTYQYHDIPLSLYTDFAEASSQGTYFNLYIRDNYSFDRIA